MANRIRVALVITELNVGGAERCLVNLAIGLDGTRFEPAVYSLAATACWGSGLLGPQPGGSRCARSILGSHICPARFSTARRLPALLGQQQPVHLVRSFLFHANVVATLAAQTLPGICIVAGIRVAVAHRTAGVNGWNDGSPTGSNASSA